MKITIVIKYNVVIKYKYKVSNTKYNNNNNKKL